MTNELMVERITGHHLEDECAREPIHLPGAIQPHGLLFVVDSERGRVTHVSGNAGIVLNQDTRSLVGRPILDLFDRPTAHRLRTVIGNASETGTGEATRIELKEAYDVVAHRSPSGVVIEFETAGPDDAEPGGASWPAVNRIVDDLRSAETVEKLCQVAAAEVRRLTGFARVKVYRFDEAWNGEVLAEDRAEHMTSYLHLHFPASDIPEQARRLYALNRIRLIPDATYAPVPLVGRSDQADVDLSLSVLRSVSPVHLAYLANMDVAASMSVSIMREGRLWGLIACHHDAPRHVSYPTRSICAVIADLMGFLLGSRQDQEDASQLARVGSAQSTLLEAIVRHDDFIEALRGHPDDLLDLVEADGAAIVTKDAIVSIGKTPPDDHVRALAHAVVGASSDDVFSTSCLRNAIPTVAEDPASAGVLAISLSRVGHQRIFWFRGEVTREVVWAGNPEKSVQVSSNGSRRLHPRASFERWKTIQRGQSRRWQQVSIQAASTLRNTIIDVALVKAERLARLNARLADANELLLKRNRELQEFTSVASHDLQEPLRKIQSFSQLLRDEYRDDIDETAAFYVDRLNSSAERMSVLLSGLLEYSRLAEKPDDIRDIDLNAVLRQLERAFALRLDEISGRIEYDGLPKVRGDQRRVYRMLECVIDNAIKFSDPERILRIHVSAGERRDEGPRVMTCLRVEDNGMGFDPQYTDRVWRPFEQIHRRDEYGGTGIGLALVRRIAEQHGGFVRIGSEVGRGTTVEVFMPAG